MDFATTTATTAAPLQVGYIGLDLTLLIGVMFGSVPGGNSILSFLSGLWTFYSFVALTASAIFIFGIVYIYIRASQLSEIQDSQIAMAEQLWQELHGGSATNARWLDVQQHVVSDNPNDWKLAIIEADIMLDGALSNAGYGGPSIGEKLKGVPPQQLRSLNDAWQAHKIRNQIAHEGADFVLTQKVARETILQYERVLKEFKAI
jgi:hypothetical protein